MPRHWQQAADVAVPCMTSLAVESGIDEWVVIVRGRACPAKSGLDSKGPEEKLMRIEW